MMMMVIMIMIVIIFALYIARILPVTGVHGDQDLIWCVKVGVYMAFCVHDGDCSGSPY